MYVCWLFGFRVVKLHESRLTRSRVGPHVPPDRFTKNGEATASGCSTLTSTSAVDGKTPLPLNLRLSELVSRYVDEEAEIVAATATAASSVPLSNTGTAPVPVGNGSMPICTSTKDTRF